MAYHVIVPETANKICKVMHQVIYQNPLNESEDVASLPLMLFAEIIEACHQIEEQENVVENAKSEKVRVFKNRTAKVRELRLALAAVIKSGDVSNKPVPKSIKGLRAVSEKVLTNWDDKDSEVYLKLKMIYDELSLEIAEAEKAKNDYRNSQIELRKLCRNEGVGLLRRTRDALKVNFLHLGNEEYIAQVKAHGFEVKKK